MEERQISRREREKLAQRRLMLDAALELFSQKGYHDTSMHEIAERSEFAIGTLYKFFKNKEDLYKALAREKATEVFGALGEPLSTEKDPLTVLEDYVQNRAKIAAEIAPLQRLHLVISQGVSFHVTQGLAQEFREWHGDHIDKLAAVMKEGIRQKLLRDEDAVSLAVALDGLARAFFARSHFEPERYPYEAYVPQVLGLFLRGGLAEQRGDESLKEEAEVARSEYS